MRLGRIFVTLTMLVMISTCPVQAFLLDRGGSECDPGGVLNLYVGWISNGGYTNFSLENGDVPLLTENLLGLEYKYNMSSLYLGLVLPIDLGEPSCSDPGLGIFTIGVACALPSQWDGDADYDLYVLGSAHRAWNADTYWAIADGIWEYPVYGDFYAVFGFRYDYWQTSFTNPISVTWPPTNTAFFTLNSYLPYFGVTTRLNGLRAGAFGLPFYIGDVVFKESFEGGFPSFIRAHGGLNEGYFLEAFLEYELPSLWPAADQDFSISLFGKFNAIEARSQIIVDYFGIPSGSYEFDFKFRRRLFMVGAMATWNFNLPDSLQF